MSYDGEVDFSVGLEITNIDELVDRIRDAIIIDDETDDIKVKRQNPYYDHAYEKIMEITQELSMVSLDLEKMVRKFDDFQYELPDIFRRTVIDNFDVFGEAASKKDPITDVFLLDELSKAQLNKKEILGSISGIRIGGIEKIDELISRIIDVEIKKPLSKQDIPSLDINVVEAMMYNLQEKFKGFGNLGLDDISRAEQYLVKDLSEEQKSAFLTGIGADPEDQEKFHRTVEAFVLWSNTSQKVLEDLKFILETKLPQYILQTGKIPESLKDYGEMAEYAKTPEGQEIFTSEDISTIEQFRTGSEMRAALETETLESPAGGVFFTTGILEKRVKEYTETLEEKKRGRDVEIYNQILSLKEDLLQYADPEKLNDMIKEIRRLIREQDRTNERLDNLGL